MCPSDTAPILTASIGNDQGVRAHDRGKDLCEHSVQPPHIAPVLTPEAKWSGRGRWCRPAEARGRQDTGEGKHMRQCERAKSPVRREPVTSGGDTAL